MAGRGVDMSALPKEVRDQLAELDLELSEGDITQKGYEKKKTKLLLPFFMQTPEPPPPAYDQHAPGPSNASGSTHVSAHTQAPPPSSSSRYHDRRSRRPHRSGGTRDDRYRSDIHTETVQAALAKHKEEKMALPMPTKRRSTYVQSPVINCTPPDSSSGSENEGALLRQSSVGADLEALDTPSLLQPPSLQSPDSWINHSVQSSSTSSSASSTLVPWRRASPSLNHPSPKPSPSTSPSTSPVQAPVSAPISAA
nr:disco-interacting protein 2 homolog B-A-like isoform X2 [Salvelinus alpinus]